MNDEFDEVKFEQEKKQRNKKVYNFLVREQLKERISTSESLLKILELDFRELKKHWAYQALKACITTDVFIERWPNGDIHFQDIITSADVKYPGNLTAEQWAEQNISDFKKSLEELE